MVTTDKLKPPLDSTYVITWQTKQTSIYLNFNQQLLWKGASCGQDPRLHQAGLALLLLVSDLSDGCTDHLPLLVLAGSTELYREISQYTTCKQWQYISCFFPPLNTILVSSSTSCTDCSFFARMSNLSADSDLKTTVKTTWKVSRTSQNIKRLFWFK